MAKPDQRSTEAAEYRRWYKTARWKRRRLAQLAAQPLCQMCMAIEDITVADVADHVTPHRGDPQLFWYGELQSLCGSCHSRHKQQEERGTIKVAYGVDGYPA